MFCSNCGKQIDNNVAFCPECGTKIAVVQAEAPVIATPIAATTETPNKKNKGPIIVIIILLLLVIASGIVIWYLYNDKKQDTGDDWESTEAFADEGDEEDEDEEEPTPEPTEAPTPEPTNEPEVEPTDDPEAGQTTAETIVWNDPVFDIDPSSYEKYSVYESEMNMNDFTITDRQVIMANGDEVIYLWESTFIDLSHLSEDEFAIYAEVFKESFASLAENPPDSAVVLYGLDGDTYRTELLMHLEDADIQALVDGGYLVFTTAPAGIVKSVSYEESCAGLEASGYILVE